MRGAGYRDGCKGQRLRNALIKLSWRGIDFNYIYASEIGKGKVVNSPQYGPNGPGLYFVHLKTYLIKPPSGPKCGLACALGKGTTVALGCNSTVSCGVQGVLIVLPGVGEARAAARAEALGEETLAAARDLEQVDEEVNAARGADEAGGGETGGGPGEEPSGSGSSPGSEKPPEKIAWVTDKFPTEEEKAIQETLADIGSGTKTEWQTRGEVGSPLQQQSRRSSWRKVRRIALSRIPCPAGTRHERCGCKEDRNERSNP